MLTIQSHTNIRKGLASKLVKSFLYLSAYLRDDEGKPVKFNAQPSREDVEDWASMDKTAPAKSEPDKKEINTKQKSHFKQRTLSMPFLKSQVNQTSVITHII